MFSSKFENFTLPPISSSHKAKTDNELNSIKDPVPKDGQVKVAEISPLLSGGNDQLIEKIYTPRPPSQAKNSKTSKGGRYRVQGPTHPFLQKLDQENAVIKKDKKYIILK